MNRLIRSITAGLCVVLMLSAGKPVEAQNVHTLTIQNGKVSIDGKEVSSDDLPVDLDLNGITATYSYVGDARPYIALNGALYTLEGQRLQPVARLRDDRGGLSLYYQDDGGDSVLLGRYNVQGRALLSTSLAQEQTQALQESTEELARLSDEVDQQQATQALEKARVQVEQAAEVMELLPKLEVQNYLSDVQQFNQTLYALLVREWRMEREAEGLAREIRNLPDGATRAALANRLRQRLSEIFELKQENRRREIQQLEQELSSLYERLRKREQWRERLIEQRFNQLIASPTPPDHR